jgi:hypothetical protein
VNILSGACPVYAGLPALVAPTANGGFPAGQKKMVMYVSWKATHLTGQVTQIGPSRVGGANAIWRRKIFNGFKIGPATTYFQ